MWRLVPVVTVAGWGERGGPQVGGRLGRQQAGVPHGRRGEVADDGDALGTGDEVRAGQIGEEQPHQLLVVLGDEVDDQVGRAGDDGQEPHLRALGQHLGELETLARLGVYAYEHGGAALGAVQLQRPDHVHEPPLPQHLVAPLRGGLTDPHPAGDGVPRGTAVELERRDDAAVQLVDHACMGSG